MLDTHTQRRRLGVATPSSVVFIPKPCTASSGMSTERLPFAVANMTALMSAMARKSELHSSCRQAGLDLSGRGAWAFKLAGLGASATRFEVDACECRIFLSSILLKGALLREKENKRDKHCNRTCCLLKTCAPSRSQ